MKNKKIIVMFVVIFLIILMVGIYMLKYVKSKKEQVGQEEYVPQEEITDEQFRQTIVSLYFVNKENGNVEPEARLVDIRDVIKMQCVIPEGSKVNKTYTENDCLTIDMSNEFLNYDKDKKDKLIKTIVNTMTELTEINSVKFIIDGSPCDELAQEYTREK